MKRRMFLAMAIPVLASACVGLGAGVSQPSPTEGVGPGQADVEFQRSTAFDGGEIHRAFMDRARDHREAAKKRRERRARARRRRRGS